MRRYFVATMLGATLLLSTAACGDDGLGPEARAACDVYHELLNDWTTGYGGEMGAVGEAEAAGDEQRRETAVAVVRELYTDFAGQLREQAEQVPEGELADALNDAAAGLDEIADQIESYDDVLAAPEQMSSGAFNDGGARVSELCAE